MIPRNSSVNGMGDTVHLQRKIVRSEIEDQDFVETPTYALCAIV